MQRRVEAGIGPVKSSVSQIGCLGGQNGNLEKRFQTWHWITLSMAREECMYEEALEDFAWDMKQGVWCYGGNLAGWRYTVSKGFHEPRCTFNL